MLSWSYMYIIIVQEAPFQPKTPDRQKREIFFLLFSYFGRCEVCVRWSWERWGEVHSKIQGPRVRPLWFLSMSCLLPFPSSTLPANQNNKEAGLIICFLNFSLFFFFVKKGKTKFWEGKIILFADVTLLLISIAVKF